MKLIVGLGNPGKKYQRTRHNLGFLAIEHLARRLSTNAKWQRRTKLKASVVELSTLSVVLAKPQTFVNSSGEAIAKIVDFYKLAPSNILIIRDDIDLAEGKVRGPKAETGSGGHLGIESIRQGLASDKFYQLKIGVGRPPENRDPADFVLEKVGNQKWKEFTNLFKTELVKKVKNWLNE